MEKKVLQGSGGCFLLQSYGATAWFLVFPGLAGHEGYDNYLMIWMCSSRGDLKPTWFIGFLCSDSRISINQLKNTPFVSLETCAIVVVKPVLVLNELTQKG